MWPGGGAHIKPPKVQNFLESIRSSDTYCPPGPLLTTMWPERGCSYKDTQGPNFLLPTAFSLPHRFIHLWDVAHAEGLGQCGNTASLDTWPAIQAEAQGRMTRAGKVGRPSKAAQPPTRAGCCSCERMHTSVFLWPRFPGVSSRGCHPHFWPCELFKKRTKYTTVGIRLNMAKEK